MLDLNKERQVLIQAHLNGASGKEIVRRYTQLIDDFVQEQWTKIASAQANEEVALIAIGGYGRQEMSFHSDVDLLILHKERPSPAISEILVDFVQSFWDYKLRLDHSFRTVKECLQMAQKHFLTFMSMLTPRFLVGNYQLYEEFKLSLQQYTTSSRKQVLETLLRKYQQRHKRYSDHIYLLEPHLKEGVGGLRDAHTILWAGIIQFDIANFDGLYQKGLLLKKEKRDLEKAIDFLWKVRNHLHYLSNRENDELSFGCQEEFARFWNLKDTGNLKAVERFMRLFFTHSFHIKHITHLFLDRILEEDRSTSIKSLAPGIFLSKGKIKITTKEVFSKDPSLLVKIYTWAAQYQAKFDISVHTHLHQIVHSFNPAFSQDLKARDAFLDFLTTNANLLPLLEDMTYQGLLCALIPEWQYILHLPQHNIYHIYTVDLHSFHVLQEIKRLQAGEYKDKFPTFTTIAQQIRNVEVLLLAALLHDLGKGAGHPHQETGAKKTREILSRWQIPEEPAETIVWLIKNHLLLSHTAQRRDLEEEKVIIDTAEKIGDLNRLEMLYVLSFADAKATGPRAFSDWKMALITELFLKIKQVMETTEFSRHGTWQSLERIKIVLAGKLKDKMSPKALYHFLEILPPRYLLHTPVEEILFHRQLAERLKYMPVVLHWENYLPPTHFKVTVATWDFLGLFAKIAGAFALHDFDILNAQVHTWGNKIALDTFWVKTKETYEIEEKQKAVEETLCAAIEGEIDLEKYLQSKCQPRPFERQDLPPVQVKIKIDNKSSYFHTIVEVHAPNKPCLLFKLAHCLSKLKLNIYLAKISTSLDHVVDVFYIQEKEGGKIEEPARIAQVKEALRTLLFHA